MYGQYFGDYSPNYVCWDLLFYIFSETHLCYVSDHSCNKYRHLGKSGLFPCPLTGIHPHILCRSKPHFLETPSPSHGPSSRIRVPFKSRYGTYRSSFPVCTPTWSAERATPPSIPGRLCCNTPPRGTTPTNPVWTPFHGRLHDCNSPSRGTNPSHTAGSPISTIFPTEQPLSPSTE